jgi:hypothetical protein
MRRQTRQLLGKKIVGVIYSRMSSNNKMRDVVEGFALADARGRLSYVYLNTVEETDGACYGHELTYPGRAVRPDLGETLDPPVPHV